MPEKEYIEREKALKYLYNSLSFSEKELDMGDFRRGCIAAIQDDIGNIANLPAADVSEVVRCKDCTKGLIREGAKFPILWCKKWENIMTFDDFCSYGVRKGN